MRHRKQTWVAVNLAIALVLATGLFAEEKRVVKPEDVVDIVAVSDPQISADGMRVAFVVTKPAEPKKPEKARDTDIWVAPADGSEPARPYAASSFAEISPRWSPDGRSVAFDSQGQDGHWDIWAIGVDGSGLRQVTRNPADENMPSSSRNGHWIYFGSNRTGRGEVWRVAAGGGTEEQVTHEGGAVPFESLDGRTLYYMRSGQGDALLARPTAGGTERVIFRCVDFRSYAVAPQGLFHVDCTPPGSRNASQHLLRYWDAATGRDRPVATFDADWTAGLSAFPDGQSVICGRRISG
jgi:dipeptidyl aminopeptidase/acylaminoacyl peptidase